MRRVVVAISLYLLMSSHVNAQTPEESVNRTNLELCITFGEVTAAITTFRDAGISMEGALIQLRGNRIPMHPALEKMEQAVANLAYERVTETPKQLRNEVIADCLKQALGQ